MMACEICEQLATAENIAWRRVMNAEMNPDADATEVISTREAYDAIAQSCAAHEMDCEEAK